MKKLICVNVGYFQSIYSQNAIEKYLEAGYGIDSIAVHPSIKETWITFYWYGDKPLIT